MTEQQRLKRVINWIIFNEIADSETDIALSLGYTKSSFSSIKNGKVPLSNKFIAKLISLDNNLNDSYIVNGGCMLNESVTIEGKDNSFKKPSELEGDNNFFSLMRIEAELKLMREQQREMLLFLQMPNRYDDRIPEIKADDKKDNSLDDVRDEHKMRNKTKRGN